MKKLATLLFAAATSASANAQSFMPENDLHLQPIIKAAMSQSDFNAVMDKAQDVYGPIISGFGKTLVIEREWNNDTVNAYATQRGSKWIVHMYGGLARRVTQDGFLGVICHELGHHLSGFPMVSSWAGNEGQSDYFVSRCMRNVVGHESATNAQAASTVNTTAKSKCDKIYSTEDDRNFCYRVMNGVKSLSDLLGGRANSTSFDKKDTRVVSQTNDNHPRAQCRLDTYSAGALCVKLNESWNDSDIPGKGMSDRAGEMDSSNYTCNTFQGDDALAVRPRCWFAPSIK
jgi:hypothetical protein